MKAGSDGAAVDRRLHDLGPGLIGAVGFACSDIFGKVALAAGADVLTLLTVRGVIGVGFLLLWRRLGRPALSHSPRGTWIAIGLGILFVPNVYGLFKAIQVVDVPTAVLTYFSYPLLTGLAAAVLGLETLGWKGVLAAVTAFFGLAVMIGAHSGQLSVDGVSWALLAAVCRTAMLLITRAELNDADPRLTAWYSIVSSTLLLGTISVVTQTWHVPHTTVGWVAFLAIGVTTTGGLLAMFTSTRRIGPFRTALLSNLEPLLATVFSILLLGDVLAPVQAVGGIVMLAAVAVFQLRRP